MTTYSNSSKNSSSFTNDPLAAVNDLTWDDMDEAWDDADGTWDNAHIAWKRSTKNSSSFTNATKN